MNQNISISPYQIQDYTEFTLDSIGSNLDSFPILSIDIDSYITQANIQTGINLDPSGNRHCLAIGKACSLADSITFLIDLNHDYGSVIQGVPSFLKGTKCPSHIKQKGTIILQNDV